MVYVRYMDDFVILATTRWHLKKAIAQIFRITADLKLRLHRGTKCFIGRTDNGFDFLGYTIHPQRRLRPSSVSLQRFVARARRLYEQGGDKQRLWEYAIHWHRWLHGGLSGLVTRKGGVNRYYIYILRRLGSQVASGTYFITDHNRASIAWLKSLVRIAHLLNWCCPSSCFYPRPLLL